MLALTIFSALLLATQVTADIDTARGSLVGLLQPRGLYRRQISPSDIPAECQSQCASTVTVLNDQNCVSAACLCTADINKGFQTCLSCVAAGDSALVTEAQGALAQYEDACNQSGVPVASLTISGANPASTRPVSSAAIPTGGASQAPSVFFSSSGAGGASTPAAGGASTPAAGGSTPTRSVVTGAPAGTGASPSSPSVSSGPVPVNGASSLSTLPGMAAAGLVVVAGAMFAL